MAFVKNSNRQITMICNTCEFTGKDHRFSKEIWAVAFSEQISSKINKYRFFSFYRDNIISNPNVLINHDLPEIMPFKKYYQQFLNMIGFSILFFRNRTWSRLIKTFITADKTEDTENRLQEHLCTEDKNETLCKILMEVAG